MLTISVKNFGPIAEGSVDLKPLTIFVGPSNTGKSYMATAVYAVMQGFEAQYNWMYKLDSGSVSGEDRTLQWKADSGRLLTIRYGGAAVEALKKWASVLLKEELPPRDIFLSVFPDNLRADIENSIRIMIDSIGQDALSKINDNYGEPVSFVRQGLPGREFLINVHRENPQLNFHIQLGESSDQHSSFDFSQESIRQPYLEPLQNYEIMGGEPEGIDSYARIGLLKLIDSATEPLFTELPLRTYYLPAARSGLVIGHKPLSAGLIRSSGLIGRWPQVQVSSPRNAFLPATVTDFLSELVSLERRMAADKQDDGLDAVAKFIETQVLRGIIDIDESGGLPSPDIVYLPTSKESQTGKFTLNQTSSMVSELAPLILFLKYLVRPGDLLILEEPESHLHPAAQRQLARGIVRLVNAGVKVLITTHSDIIISQINNLLALNQASPELIDKGGFEPEDFLQEDQVGAFLFRHNQELGGSEVVRLDIDPDTGIDEDEFADVFEAIYNESIALQRDRS